MTDEVRVTTSQTDAARLIVERNSANGKPTSEAIRKIASAKPLPEETNNPGPRATAAGGKKRWLRGLLARVSWRRASAGEG